MRAPVEERPGYDEKLTRILKEAASVFAAKGYHQASIRDISAAAGFSLSGLYYYFDSKEELLFLIQRRCFQTIVERARSIVAQDLPSETRLRLLVRSHLRFFLTNMREMKVLSHEADILTGDYGDEVAALKREYVGIVTGLLEELRPDPDGADVRVATLGLFGMMNWMYTWYRRDRDPDGDELADQMIHVFLNGFLDGPVDRTLLVDGSDRQPDPSAPSIWQSP